VVRRWGMLKYQHRVEFEKHVRPIQKGERLKRKCQTPGCCNPEHWENVPGKHPDVTTDDL